MPLLESLAHRILLGLPAETAHGIALAAVAKGFAKDQAGGDGNLSRIHFGVRFPNPVGLAAGFDKDAVAVEQWKRLGFGFVEVGTVTRHAQQGNPKPRLFRLKPERALINRLGFNNCGADAMARNLEGKDAGIPVGVNIGKSQATPLDEAHEDYAYSFSLLKGFSDYVVVNVSSPNTPGLRELQDKDSLRRILVTLKEIDESKPLFVKIAPDMTLGAIEDVVAVAQECGLTGIVCTNTTVSRNALESDPGIEGGLSGAPLTSMADEALRFTKEICGESLMLIGVGGIMNSADAERKMKLGADLVQVYTGWVYGGPGFVPDLLDGLRRSDISD
ncbi:MAG: quinone-dependent dihydroorotate dehydrogenase [Armatimonadetes bacterium]|nr:quinone-dependent dihydroorotate dehydrogenase [Armatimonadota bacterium]